MLVGVAAFAAFTPALSMPVLADAQPPANPRVPGFAAQAAKPSFGDSRDRVDVSAVGGHERIGRGGRSVVAVILDHESGWHSWTNPGPIPQGMTEFDGAIRTEIKPAPTHTGPLTVHEALIQWPEAHSAKADVGEGPQDYAVFSDRAVIFVPVSAANDAALGPARAELHLTFQTCDDSTCLMPAFDVPLTIEFEVVAADDASRDALDPAVFADFDASVLDRVGGGPSQDAGDPATPVTAAPAGPLAPSATSRPKFFGVQLPSAEGAIGVALLALFSMIGGFILNLTPCVLPIIPIKVLTISQHAGTPGRTLALGLWMALGVVAFWAGIGIPAALFTSAADPSRLFGIWWVTLGVGLLIGAMGMGIMGLFTIQLPASAYAVNPKADTAWGSFLFGVMTAVLGLPCFGFVAGALLAGSAALPPAVIMTIFTSIGIGMAAPYLVLAAKPSLVDRIPRTGPASELVKQVMGLLLIAAATYFVGSGLIALVSERPYLSRQLHWWAVALCTVIAGVWLMWRTFQITPRPLPRAVFTIIGVALGVTAVLYALDSTAKARVDWNARQQVLAASSGGYATGAWNDFSVAAFDKARGDGRVIVLDFTAEWCLTCKALKATVLNREPVRSALKDPDVVAFTVDLTSRTAPGWDTLRALGKTGIPLLAVYTPGADVPWQANAYTADDVMLALSDARTQSRRVASKEP